MFRAKLTYGVIVGLVVWSMAWTAVAEEIEWTEHMVQQKTWPSGTTIIFDFDGDSDNDILFAEYQKNYLAWMENDGSQNFTERIIDANADVVLGAALDFDNDSDFDIVCSSSAGLFWWENDGNLNFTRRTIANEGGGIQVVDMDDDGDWDVASKTENPSEVDWWENDGQMIFDKHLVDANYYKPCGMDVEDIDGDGDMDIVATSYWGDNVSWWENDGDEIFTYHNLGSLNNVTSIHAVDLDQDNDCDMVIGTGDWGDEIWWLENDGSENYTLHNICDNHAFGVADVADIDGDGDLDLLTAFNWNEGYICWWENDGFQNFVMHVIAMGGHDGGGRSLCLGDLDQDGDLDITGSLYAASNRSLLWWESDLMDPIVTINPTPLIAGQIATLTATRFDPFTETYMAFTLSGPGSKYVPFLDVTLDLNRPRKAGDMVLSDDKGDAVWDLTVPANYCPFLIWVQAAQYGQTSKVLQTEVIW